MQACLCQQLLKQFLIIFLKIQLTVLHQNRTIQCIAVYKTKLHLLRAYNKMAEG